MMEQGDDRRILFLFRHGETDWNREGRLQGHTDTPLNATGLAQAEALAETLRPHRLDAVVSSDLMRAWTTARIVAEALGLPLLADPGLRETNVGAAEGLLWIEAKVRFGESLTQRWYSDGDVGTGAQYGALYPEIRTGRRAPHPGREARARLNFVSASRSGDPIRGRIRGGWRKMRASPPAAAAASG